MPKAHFAIAKNWINLNIKYKNKTYNLKSLTKQKTKLVVVTKAFNSRFVCYMPPMVIEQIVGECETARYLSL